MKVESITSVSVNYYKQMSASFIDDKLKDLLMAFGKPFVYKGSRLITEGLKRVELIFEER